MLNFDQIEIIVDGTGILAENFSLNSSNSLEPIYSIGYKGIINQVPEGPIRTTFNISYIPKLDAEPIYAQTKTIKGVTGSYSQFSGINIVFGGTTGYRCFLESFSIQSSPNQIVKANASFVSFLPLSGTLRAKPSHTTITNVSGQLGHAWTTHIISGNSYLTAPIYDFVYDFTASWEPIYILGNTEPIQVELLRGSERMTFLRDVYHHIQFSGEMAQNQSSNSLLEYVAEDQSIDILKYDFLSNSASTNQGIVISISGQKIKSSNLTANLDDFVKTVTEVNNYF